MKAILKQKWWIWALVIAIILIIVLVIWYFWPPSVPDPNKSNTPVPPGSPSPKWLPEVFPLNVGMFGTKIKALQNALGITADGKFGPQTQGAITSKGYLVPLDEASYNAIINPNLADVGKFAYAKNDGTTVYKPNYSVYKTYSKDDFIGKIILNSSGTSPLNYTINGGYIVPVADVYLK